MSEPTPHERIRALFDGAFDQPPDQRRAWLKHACGDDDALCARVAAMIAAAEDDHFLGAPTTGLGAATEDETSAPDDLVGTVIDRYKVLERIGEGGFGVVYMAEQTEPVRRRVALKVIKLGMDTKQVIARFEAERQALALMDHPGIATVLDAGTTERGRPYFVMELVRGEPLTAYCDREALEVTARLRLFQDVCGAVQHAHAKGVIHRDLKPSNVLVTRVDDAPVPKVIDFGIAKATSTPLTEKTYFTQFRQLIGTPAYMSPEQAALSGVDVDTRSDVYALGVLLYELLTGTTPFDSRELNRASADELRRIIREDTPARPSTRLSTMADALVECAAHRRTAPQKLGGLLRGDLDWIVMRALEKDRERRYDTASAFAQDVQRYLDGDVVEATPPSTTYRVRKFVHRHRAGVLTLVGFAALLLLGLIGTTSGLLWALSEKQRADGAAADATLAAVAESAARIEAQRSADAAAAAEADARQRADELEDVTAFQSRQLETIDVPAMGAQLRASFLDAALAAGEQRGTPDDVTRRAFDELSAGADFSALALQTLRANLFTPTADAIAAQFEDQPLVEAQLQDAFGHTTQELGLFDLADAALQRAITLRTQELGADHPETLEVMVTHAAVQHRLGATAVAAQRFEEAIDGIRRTLGGDAPLLATALVMSGDLLIAQQRFDDATAAYHEAMTCRQRVLGPDDAATWDAVAAYAWAQYRSGHADDAEALLRDAVAGKARLLGPAHPSTCTTMNSLGQVLSQRGAYDEAETLLREACDGFRIAFGAQHPRYLIATVGLGNLLRRQERFDEASALLRDTLAMLRTRFGPTHPDTLYAQRTLAAVCTMSGAYDEGAALYEASLDAARLRFGAASAEAYTALRSLGRHHVEAQRLDVAEQQLREAWDGLKRVRSDAHPMALLTMRDIAMTLSLAGAFERAVAFDRDALEVMRRVRGEDHLDTFITTMYFGEALERTGRFDDAIDLLRGGIARATERFSAQHPLVRDMQGVLGSALSGTGAFEEAEPLLLGAVSLDAPLSVYARRTVQRIIAHYERWHAADPAGGHDARAEPWRATLAASDVADPAER